MPAVATVRTFVTFLHLDRGAFFVGVDLDGQDAQMLVAEHWRDAADQRREQVIDLYLRRCVDAIRSNGL